MRKFYLLLAEHLARQREEDARTYRLLAVHMKDPPEPGALFASLRTGDQQPEETDDDTVFQAVAASMLQYSR